MKRTLVIGDIHGNLKGLLQVLERCNFDNENDTLISLGDVVDGHSQSYEVVEELLKIKNLIAIKGNHDDWFNQWIKTGVNPSNWKQGQDATGKSYLRRLDPKAQFTYINRLGITMVRLIPEDIPDTHIKFFENQLPYYIDKNNNLFVHGGFNRHYPIEEQGDILWWDRDFWSQALSYGNMVSNYVEEKCTCSCHNGGHIMHIQACCENGYIKTQVFKPPFKMVGDYKEVFLGHTQTQFWGESKPMHAANVWNLDTGGGWFGYVTIMDVETKEFWQSDDTKTLYPEFKGRN